MMELLPLHVHLQNTRRMLQSTALLTLRRVSRQPTPASLPLLNARAQIVVRNQREACTRSETNKTAAQRWRSS